MVVNNLTLMQYRNIENLNIDFSHNLNIICGKNAQGKTNIIESIWLLTGYKSFRGGKDSDIIMFGKDIAKIKAQYQTSIRKIVSEITLSDKRRAYKNGVLLNSPSILVGEFPVTIFSPTHLSLIKDGPAERRKFLDISLCQLSPSYREFVKKYRYALAQRNVLLKDLQYNSLLYDTLEIWEMQLALYGAKIIYKRLKYIDYLKKFSENVYNGICGGTEKFNIKYDFASCNEKSIKTEDEIRQLLINMLKNTRKNDIILKSTGVGPHRDDLCIFINGKSARTFGSQGQQRSAALSLKLGETEVIKEITNESPLVLLDDVMSELDYKRQDYIFNKIKDYQVIITTCELSGEIEKYEGKIFKIENGGLIK